MRLALVALLALVGGCIHDRYVCATDADCNLGSGGRCELDGRCTQLDGNCRTARRYSDHGAEAGACFTAGTTLLDPFAAGQAPAIADGCIAQVCDALPSCCASGWTEACVQLAEISCDQPHDTRIAITATRGGGQLPQLWDLRWNGSAWFAIERPDLATAIGWLAPAPGETAPRFYGGAKDGALQIDGAAPVSLAAVLDSVTSIDFDLSGRDHVAISTHASGASTGGIELVDLGSGARSALATDSAYSHPSWGAIDDDPYPDVVASLGGTYVVLSNVGVDGSAARDLRSIGNSAETTTDVGASLRSLAWADLDGDHQLDLVAFGGSVRLHFDPITGIPDHNLDCDPLVETTGAACTTAERTAIAYAGAAAPGQVVIATVPDTGTGTNETAGPIYRVATTRTAFAPIRLMTPTCVGPCYAPIRALAMRDLDGDHILDIIAIDANLAVLYSLSTVSQTQLILAAPIPAPVSPQTQISISVTGALNP